MSARKSLISQWSSNIINISIPVNKTNSVAMLFPQIPRAQDKPERDAECYLSDIETQHALHRLLDRGASFNNTWNPLEYADVCLALALGETFEAARRVCFVLWVFAQGYDGYPHHKNA